MQHKIVIITDGKETHARQFVGKKVIKSAKAKCSPDDAFDFNIGAKLAFERLMKEEKNEWRVVNRPAKIGDYIRLTRATYSFNRVGDVLKVDDASGSIGVLGKNHPRCTGDDGFMWHYLTACAEVIERVEEKKVEKPKYYNGKVVCVESDYSFWTAGKVYEIKDGGITDDQGDSRNKYFTCFEDVAAWTKRLLGTLKFIPYVD